MLVPRMPRHQNFLFDRSTEGKFDLFVGQVDFLDFLSVVL